MKRYNFYPLNEGGLGPFKQILESEQRGKNNNIEAKSLGTSNVCKEVNDLIKCWYLLDLGAINKIGPKRYFMFGKMYEPGRVSH